MARLRARRARRFLSFLSGALNLGLLLLAVAATAWWWARPPVPDAFYLPRAGEPRPAGTLLNSEPFARAVPEGAQGWRILYATTRPDGSPALASAIVLARRATSDQPRDVIAWAHGTSGLATGCAPSLMPDPFADVPALSALLRAGWVYVATDYVGLGTPGRHAYLVGEDAARAVLDAVRAARGIEGLPLTRRAVVWGHSQGGHAALWAGIAAQRYAADVELMGVAALAPTSDLPRLLQAVQATTFGKIVSSFLVSAYGDLFPETNARGYLRLGARRLVADISGRCARGWQGALSAFETVLLPPDGIFQTSPATGALGGRLAANVPRGPMAAPLLIAQGEADALVLPEIQRGYVTARCSEGQGVEYRTYPDRDHLSLIAPDSPVEGELIAWTRERFAGWPPTPNCAPR